MNENGYEITLGELWRPEEMSAIYSKRGIGIKNSLHCKKLAIDINLFKNGKYLSSSKDHKIFGDWWENQHINCRWGGRYGDGNHYEFLEQSRKET